MSHGSDGVAEYSDSDDELVESDIELDSPEVEPDNDLSQKVDFYVTIQDFLSAIGQLWVLNDINRCDIVPFLLSDG